MHKKLSASQQRVINALMENEGSYLQLSSLYHWSKVCDKNKKVLILSVYKTTVESLINKKLLVEFEKDKYKLNPDFKQVIKN